MLLRLLAPLAGPGGPLRARIARIVLLLDAVFMLAYSALALVFRWSGVGIVVGMVIVLGIAVSHRWLLRSDASHDCPALAESDPQLAESDPQVVAESDPGPSRGASAVAIVGSSAGLIASGILFVLHLVRDDLRRPERQIFTGSAFLIGLASCIGLIAAIARLRQGRPA